jgi:hypothetical protein
VGCLFRGWESETDKSECLGECGQARMCSWGAGRLGPHGQRAMLGIFRTRGGDQPAASW